MNYYQKYLKYKEKYENLLQQTGGSNYQVEEGEFEINDPRIMDQLENVSILPMGYHTFYEGKNLYPEIKQSNTVSVQTFPYYNTSQSNRRNTHSYTKISDAEMTGQPISLKNYKSDKDCAETCSNNRNCQSFNISKKGKKKQCEFHSNSSRFVPDNIHNSEGSNYFEKTYNY
jgi:hypothetical protein